MDLPLHPILNHFPIALVTVSIVSDLLGRWKQRPSLAATAWWTLGYAAVLAPLAALSGWYFLEARGDMGHAEMRIHRSLGTALAIVIPLFAVWRWRIHQRAALPGTAYLAAAILLAVSVGVQGYLGGKMTFGHAQGEAPGAHGHEMAAAPQEHGAVAHEHEGAATPHGHEDAAEHERNVSSGAEPGLKAEVVAGPASRPSRVPRFAVDGDGDLHMSWVAETSSVTGIKRAELFFARYLRGAWEPAVRIAGGEDWFVNWADFPALAVLGERELLACYLRRSGGETYDYHVELVRSADGGASWSKPARLHEDAGPGEHGFVTLVPTDDVRCTAVWLDGRDAQVHGAGPGETRLYARQVRAYRALGPEILLDERVCDCCPTAALRMTDGAVLVAYRDRSSDEVRDISLVRLATGSVPETLWTSADGWKIAGCPVNGPALAAAAERIGLVWFTLGADGASRVLCTFSEDGGKHFSAPVTLAQQRAQGRVDAVFDADGRLIVTWLEADERSAEWRVARVGLDGHVAEAETVVVTTGARDSGLARLARDGDAILFAFTEAGPPPCVAVRKLVWE